MKRTPMKRSAPLRASGPSRTSVKVKKCAVKECRQPFIPRSMTHKACGPDCAQILGKAEAEKKAKRAALEDRKQTRAQLEALKTRSDWIKETQIVVNRYVRLRDAGKGCISCGVSLALGGVGGGFDAGHYRSRGSAPHLRFDLRNIHGQCKRCNNQLAGNAIEFRRGLVERFDLAFVEAIESDQEPRRHTVEEMAEIRKLIKQLERS